MNDAVYLTYHMRPYGAEESNDGWIPESKDMLFHINIKQFPMTT